MRWLYRVVSRAEFDQILRTGEFRYGGGAEGKYYWESLEDAVGWSRNVLGTRIVRAEYPDAIADEFFLIEQLDGQKRARFADLSQMNKSLIRIEPLPTDLSARDD